MSLASGRTMLCEAYGNAIEDLSRGVSSSSYASMLQDAVCVRKGSSRLECSGIDRATSITRRRAPLTENSEGGASCHASFLLAHMKRCDIL